MVVLVPENVVHYHSDVEQKRKPLSTAQEQKRETGVRDVLWKDGAREGPRLYYRQIIRVRVRFGLPQLNINYDLKGCKQHEMAGKDQGYYVAESCNERHGYLITTKLNLIKLLVLTVISKEPKFFYFII